MNTWMDTQEKVFAYIREHHMLQAGDRVVAGVSGGADSVCLLFLLLEWQKEVPTDIAVVHVDHGIRADHPYTCRFGMEMLMMHFLDENFRPEYLEIPAAVHSEEYYVNMMIAWFYATALAKQWDAAVSYIEEKRLNPWTHNKTIQKARESYRITPEQKEYLKTLKV